MAQQPHYEIRNFKPQDYEMVAKWCNNEGWNHFLYDYKAYQHLDPEGFWLGILDGQPIASISAVKHDDKYGFVGLYIVQKERRGKGYGYQLWKKALQRVSDLNLGLDGVLAQEKNYEKSGFKTYNKTLRYDTEGKGEEYKSENLVDIKEANFEDLSTFDLKMFSAKRAHFLKELISMKENYGVAFVKEVKILGYGCFRPCDLGYRVSPLFAETPEVAEQILKNLLGQLKPTERLYIDVPDINKDAIELVATKYKMNPGFVCARMYNKNATDAPMSTCVYGVTSVEFG